MPTESTDNEKRVPLQNLETMMQLLHVMENQLDGLWFISALLDSLGINLGLGETLGHGLIRVTLDDEKPRHIAKDHTKFDIRAKDASDFTDYRRLATEVLAQLGYRFHSIGFQPPPRENADPHASVMTIAGIKPMKDTPLNASWTPA